MWFEGLRKGKDEKIYRSKHCLQKFCIVDASNLKTFQDKQLSFHPS
jgi:hypothetical protein